jgi:hypothetical protein
MNERLEHGRVISGPFAFEPGSGLFGDFVERGACPENVVPLSEIQGLSSDRILPCRTCSIAHV